MYAVQVPVGMREVVKGDKRRKKLASEAARYCQACPSHDRTRLRIDNKERVCERCLKQGRKPPKPTLAELEAGMPQAGPKPRRRRLGNGYVPHLIALMEEKGVSGRELALACGRDHRTITDYRSCKLRVNEEVARLMAERLGVSIEELGYASW